MTYMDDNEARAWLAWRDWDLPPTTRWAVMLAWLQDQPNALGIVATMAGVTEDDWERAGHWLGQTGATE